MRPASLLALVFLLLALPAQGTNESCVECHTDGSILSSLVTVPKVPAAGGVGAAAPPPAVDPSTYFRNFLVETSILKTDPHFTEGCTFCHKGDGKSTDQEKAHKGVVKQPSRDPEPCAGCHDGIVKTYRNAVHYTTQGILDKVSLRMSRSEQMAFSEKVFERSCRSCHASCGDCHVQSPSGNGVSAGFIDKHRFVKRDEKKTCGVCHGGRVYPEYTGEYSGTPDVHFQKGMACTACHTKRLLHGTAGAGDRPQCRTCHKKGKEANPTGRLAHEKHDGKVSCYGCHAQGKYRNCYDCHKGRAASSVQAFILGADPRDKRFLTTLRSVPLARSSFLDEGIRMERFDNVPDYRAAPLHTIRKNTERSRSCDICHVARKDFLSTKALPKNGSKANEGLIFRMGIPSIH